MKIVDALRQIGLNEKESAVYNASLSEGKATVEQIAKAAQLVRTSTYTQVESLMKKGLMTSYVVGKKTYYVAEAPTNLSRLLDSQESQTKTGRDILSTLLPELLDTYTKKSGDKPAIRFFPGKEGLITMREEVLKMDGKELLIVSNYDGLLKVFSTSERDAFSKRRHEKDISTRILYSKNPTTDPKVDYKLKTFHPTNIRILPLTTSELAFDIYIYDDKICLSSFDDELWGIMIIGKAVNESIRLLFEVAWISSKPI